MKEDYREEAQPAAIQQSATSLIDFERSGQLFTEKIYNRLNAEQRRAIDTYIEEGSPTIVVGVPGSGKTRMLVALVLKLYFDGEPLQNILCITYTDKGRNEMRERVGEYLFDIMRQVVAETPELRIGDLALRRIATSIASTLNVETFHSFALSLVQRYAHRIGKADYQIADDLDIISIATGIIDTLPADSPVLRMKDPYYAIRALISLFSLMKREQLTPADVINACEQEMRDITAGAAMAKQIAAAIAPSPERKRQPGISKEIKVALENALSKPFCERFIYLSRREGAYEIGDSKQHTISAAHDRLRELQHAAALLPAFDKQLNILQLFTFDDIISAALKIMAENEDLLGEIRERYLHIVVDEMQDTGANQDTILRHILQYYKDAGLPVQIFRVGDDDQMLFEYSGVRMDTMSAFLDFAEVRQQDLRPLTKNYRSTHAIIEAALNVINHNTLRLMGQKTIEVHANTSAEAPPVLALEFPSDIAENAYVLHAVKSLIAAGTNPADIAILYRTHRQAEQLIMAFEGAKVPYNVKKSINVLEVPLVQQLMTLLDYFDIPPAELTKGEPALWEILCYPFVGLNASDVFTLSHVRKQVNDKLREAGSVTRYTIRECLTNPEFLEMAQLSIPSRVALHNFATRLEQAHLLYVTEPPYRFVCRLLDLFGIHQYIEHQQEARFLKEALFALLALIERLATKHSTHFTIKNLTAHLENMRRERVPLKHDKIIETQSGVNFMAVHAAKGGEWKYVFGIGITQRAWDTGVRTFEYEMPATLTHLSTQSAEEEQARRLLYVLITRAKYQLTLSYHTEDSRNMSHMPSTRLLETGLPITKVYIEQ